MHTPQNEVTGVKVFRSGAFPGAIRQNKSILGICAATVALVVGAPASANAVELGMLLTVPALLNEVLLIISLIAVFVALRVYQLVKGGLLAKSWQFFFIGLLCLALAQMITFFANAGLFVAPELAQPVLLLAMGALWLYGALKAKQALG